MTKRIFLFLLLLPIFSSYCIADETFPQPPQLQPDVDFWTDVFTTYGNDEGVLHDNRNLAIVYARIAMPENLSRRVRQRRVDVHRKALRVVLKSLASGKRDNLTEEESRVLALWPADVNNSTIASAAGQVRFQL